MSSTPVPPRREVGWRQVIGLAQGDDPFWGRVRGHQLAQLDRNIPFNVTALTLNMALLLIAFGPQVGLGKLAPWLAGIAGMALLWVGRRLAGVRMAGPAPEATRVQLWRIVGETGILSVCWAMLIATMLPLLPADGQAVLLFESLVFLDAASVCVITIPAAMLAVSLPVGAAIILVVPAGAPLDHYLVSAGLVTILAVLLRASLRSAYMLMLRLKSDVELAEQGEVVRLLLNEYEANSADWLIELDDDGRLIHVTQRLAEVSGRPRADLVDRPLITLTDPVQGTAATAALAHAIHNRLAFRDLVVPVPVGRDLRWWALSGTPRHDGQGRFVGFRGVGRDVTDMRRSQERIAQLARFDPLTGLANRALFRETLDDLVEQAADMGRPVALLFIDLDRFKAVNDCFGHAAGDLLLRQVAQRLQGLIKGAATIARLGGDEFAVVLPDASAERAERIARRIVKELARPFPFPGEGRAGAVVVGASVGWAMAPADADTPEALLRCADMALYRVKEMGRGDVCRFDGAMAQAAAERRRMEADLADALVRGELSLFFQPVVNAADERITGFEALLRWNHPELGPVPPLRFIPVAEETGLIVPIGHWVIEQALAWAARWPADIRVAVNLSAAQMEDAGLPGLIADALARHGLTADRLELELTESLFLSDKPSVKAVLARLTELGVGFALDDFGTGYSALGTLGKG